MEGKDCVFGGALDSIEKNIQMQEAEERKAEEAKKAAAAKDPLKAGKPKELKGDGTGKTQKLEAKDQDPLKTAKPKELKPKGEKSDGKIKKMEGKVTEFEHPTGGGYKSRPSSGRTLDQGAQELFGKRLEDLTSEEREDVERWIREGVDPEGDKKGDNQDEKSKIEKLTEQDEELEDVTHNETNEAVIDPRRKELARALKAKGYYISSSYKDPRAYGQFRHKVEVDARERKGGEQWEGGLRRLSPQQVEEIQKIVISIIPEAFPSTRSPTTFTWESSRGATESKLTEKETNISNDVKELVQKAKDAIDGGDYPAAQEFCSRLSQIQAAVAEPKEEEVVEPIPSEPVKVEEPLESKEEDHTQFIMDDKLQEMIDLALDAGVEVEKLEEAKKKDPKAKLRNRGDVVFPADSPKVTDDKDHFPINNQNQARNALARANQYGSAPKWYKGSLDSLVKKVANAVQRKYKGIEVTKAAKTPGKG